MSSRALRFSHDWHVFLQTLLAGLLAVVVSMVFLLAGDFSFKVQWTVGVIVIICWLGCTAAARMRVVRSLQTMANLLFSLREGDFSIRGRGAGGMDPLGDLMAEINSLSATLQAQRSALSKPPPSCRRSWRSSMSPSSPSSTGSGRRTGRTTCDPVFGSSPLERGD